MSEHSMVAVSVSPIIYSNPCSTHGVMLADDLVCVAHVAGVLLRLLTSELDSMLDMSISMLLAGCSLLLSEL